MSVDAQELRDLAYSLCDGSVVMATKAHKVVLAADELERLQVQEAAGDLGRAAWVDEPLMDALREVRQLKKIIQHVTSTPNHSITSCPPLTRQMCPYQASVRKILEEAPDG